MKLSLSATVFAFVATMAHAEDLPKIVTDHYVLEWMTEQLIGDAAQVSVASPEGVDPSFWRPTPSEISLIQQADLIVLNGAEFSKWPSRSSLPRSRVVDTSGSFGDKLIMTEEVTHSHGADGEHSHTGTASYTWLDFELASLQAQNIAKVLSQRFPQQKGSIDASLADLTLSLRNLDDLATKGLEGFGEVEIIATHPRYQYFARAYGLNVSSMEWEAGAMPSQQDWQDLAQVATANKSTLIIWERQPPAEAIAEAQAMGIASVVFEPLATQPKTGDFLSVMAEQIDGLVRVIDKVK